MFPIILWVIVFILFIVTVQAVSIYLRPADRETNDEAQQLERKEDPYSH
ncbi:hypothetical protein NLX67_04410 [Domibacillus sp. A3M-37]|nr:hypothetical protein [Domibacillus sp. A3M-37]MCP3761629.1 hypothetical protein [Domibacillus sp. A3M-37]